MTPLFFALDFGSAKMTETLLFLGFMIVAALVTTLIAKGISYR